MKLLRKQAKYAIMQHIFDIFYVHNSQITVQALAPMVFIVHDKFLILLHSNNLHAYNNHEYNNSHTTVIDKYLALNFWLPKVYGF